MVTGKVTTAPSTNIFTNREYENLLRSLNLRRLSYALYCGEKNQFLTSLPTIQEKLVDVLRNVPAPIVQAEVYLCVRVLLCRLSAHNLVSFWPVILTEMVKLQTFVKDNLTLIYLCSVPALGPTYDNTAKRRLGRPTLGLVRV